jgi:NIMA (never in mitosis gene a)-related kinase
VTHLQVSAVLEFTEDGDLNMLLQKHIVDDQPFPETRILRWMVQILFGLKTIHSRKLMHRDIKPANVFLSQFDCVKLVSSFIL